MTIKIDGKDYDEKQFSPKLQNYIVARQELQTSKTRLEIEVEKCDVLTTFYNEKIVAMLKKEVKEKEKK
jgi:hypothetical protein|tara:strand:- start:3496 stop:3702 length:207 start_codon:yes stop_codon:yes gene_type:complete